MTWSGKAPILVAIGVVAGAWHLGLLGCATHAHTQPKPQPYVAPAPPQPVLKDEQRPLPELYPPVVTHRLRVVRFRDVESQAESRPARVTVKNSSPMPANASVGVQIDPAQVDTVLVFTPEVAPPESGLALPDYNAYAASVERGFMDAQCKVVDRRRLEKLREEWRLRQDSANAVDPKDTIALGKLLNARIVVFAEHLSAATERLPVSYRPVGASGAARKPKAEWRDAAEAEDPKVWRWDPDEKARAAKVVSDWKPDDDRYHHATYVGKRAQYSTKARALWTADETFFSWCVTHRGAGYTPNGLTEYRHGFAIPGYGRRNGQMWRWKYVPPRAGVFPVWEPPNDSGGDFLDVGVIAFEQSPEELNRQDERAHEDYFNRRLPEKREWAICDGERAVIISEPQLRWFRSLVADQRRLDAGFVAMPVVSDDGTVEYEGANDGGAGMQEAGLPVTVVNLTAKVVVVETSQVAWIGSSRLAYTDILEKPIEIPVTAAGPDLTAWPGAERQKAEILAKIFSFTAREFMTRIRAEKK